MKTSNMLIILVLLVFFHFLSIPKMINSQSCNTMSCKSKKSSHSISIKSPFRVENHQPKYCGSPGFDLYCDNDNLGPLLDLPHAGNFTVDAINYSSKTIELSDPNDCLPQKLLSLDLTTTPFMGVSQSNDFWVYKCSRLGHHNGFFGNEIVCLRGSNYTIVSGKEGEIVSDNESNCTLLKIVFVPTEYDLRHLADYSRIYLTWDQQNCVSCENMKAKTTPTTNDSKTPNLSRMMAVVISTSVVLTLICILITLCLRMSKHDAQQRAAAATTTTATTTNNNTIHNLMVAHARSSTSTSSEDNNAGLDHLTINSYPMVVVGESRRLIRLDDNKCSICLSDYFPGDTLIILPECLHRFHVDCIRSWLSTKPTCPICRTSPRSS